MRCRVAHVAMGSVLALSGLSVLAGPLVDPDVRRSFRSVQVVTPPTLECSDGGAAAANTVTMNCGGPINGTTERVDVVIGGPASGTTTLRGLNFDVTYDPAKLEYVPPASYTSPLFPNALISVTLANGQQGRLVVAIQQPGDLAAVSVGQGQHLVISFSFRAVAATFGPTPLAFDRAQATAASTAITFASGPALSYLCTSAYWYADGDGDGYGNPGLAVSTCDQPLGYVANNLDCNDANPSIHPGASDVCNGIDDNCNGQVDDDASGMDSDADGLHNACDNCRFAYNPDQLDSDGDHVGNSCDNCVAIANPEQQDLDSDLRGDACDNCLSAYNPFQDDSDGDRRGDACDNCLFDYNPAQSDFNHDGEGDICDLNDGLIYVYSTDKNYREWQAESGYTTWNSYRGSLAVLRATGQYTQAPGSNPLAARDCGLSDPYVFDVLVPAPGEVAFNLVTGMVGGAESSLGTNSAGVPRANANPCP